MYINIYFYFSFLSYAGFPETLCLLRQRSESGFSEGLLRQKLVGRQQITIFLVLGGV